jgi:hypothetical protein
MKVFKSHQAQEDLIDIWTSIYLESEMRRQTGSSIR